MKDLIGCASSLGGSSGWRSRGFLGGAGGFSPESLPEHYYLLSSMYIKTHLLNDIKPLGIQQVRWTGQVSCPVNERSLSLTIAIVRTSRPTSGRIFVRALQSASEGKWIVRQCSLED